MPAIHAAKEILIEKTVSEVYAFVRDFEKWPEWSPWLVCDNETAACDEIAMVLSSAVVNIFVFIFLFLLICQVYI